MIPEYKTMDSTGPSDLVQSGNSAQNLLESIDFSPLDGYSTEALIAWAMDQFSPRLALSASFGSPEAMAILDMMHRVSASQTRVFMLDTGRLPQETHNLVERVRERYGLPVEVYFPRAEPLEQMVRAHGANLFYDSVEKRRLCCHTRKRAPLERALSGLDAWLTGLRSGQTRSRHAVPRVERDRVHGGRIKVNPLADWTRDEVWDYVRTRNVPTNALHQKGYPSVGCAPCTRAVQPGEDERAGRWWWERDGSQECGLHYEENGSGI